MFYSLPQHSFFFYFWPTGTIAEIAHDIVLDIQASATADHDTTFPIQAAGINNSHSILLDIREEDEVTN